MSTLEETLLKQINHAGLPTPEREYPTGYGKHRFDFAWPAFQLAVEVEGGTFVKGRHSRGAGYAKDAKKYNEAQLKGWTVLRVTGDMVRSSDGIDIVRRGVERFMSGNGGDMDG